MSIYFNSIGISFFGHRLSRFLNCKITILSVYVCENLRPIELVFNILAFSNYYHIFRSQYETAWKFD